MEMPVVNLRYGWKPGNDVVGYMYLQDQARTGQNAGTGLADGSNQIWGLRANGAYPLGEKWNLLYTAEYAKQDSYAGSTSVFDADYYHLGIGASGRFFARVDGDAGEQRWAADSDAARRCLFRGGPISSLAAQGRSGTCCRPARQVEARAAELHRSVGLGSFDLGNEFDIAWRGRSSSG
jgi:hypothetical protein